MLLCNWLHRLGQRLISLLCAFWFAWCLEWSSSVSGRICCSASAPIAAIFFLFPFPFFFIFFPFNIYYLHCLLACCCACLSFTLFDSVLVSSLISVATPHACLPSKGDHMSRLGRKSGGAGAGSLGYAYRCMRQYQTHITLCLGQRSISVSLLYASDAICSYIFMFTFVLRVISPCYSPECIITR